MRKPRLEADRDAGAIRRCHRAPILADNSEKVGYQQKASALFGFFVRQVMKATAGKLQSTGRTASGETGLTFPVIRDFRDPTFFWPKRRKADPAFAGVTWRVGGHA